MFCVPYDTTLKGPRFESHHVRTFFFFFSPQLSIISAESTIMLCSRKKQNIKISMKKSTGGESKDFTKPTCPIKTYATKTNACVPGYLLLYEHLRPAPDLRPFQHAINTQKSTKHKACPHAQTLTSILFDSQLLHCYAVTTAHTPPPRRRRRPYLHPAFRRHRA